MRNRISYNEELLRLNRSSALTSLKLDQEHEALRALMVEKHGLERVLEVEREICGIND